MPVNNDTPPNHIKNWRHHCVVNGPPVGDGNNKNKKKTNTGKNSRTSRKPNAAIFFTARFATPLKTQAMQSNIKQKRLLKITRRHDGDNVRVHNSRLLSIAVSCDCANKPQRHNFTILCAMRRAPKTINVRKSLPNQRNDSLSWHPMMRPGPGNWQTSGLAYRLFDNDQLVNTAISRTFSSSRNKYNEHTQNLTKWNLLNSRR